MDRLKDIKEAMVETVNDSQAKHPIELFQELLVYLYTVGYQDGKEQIDPREGYGEIQPCERSGA